MGLTAADTKFLMNAFECLKQPMTVDYEKLAELTGVSNGRVAANGFRTAMNKIKDGTAGSTPTKKTGADDSTGGAKVTKSNTAKPKRTPAKVKSAAMILPGADTSDAENGIGNGIKHENDDDDGVEADVDTPVASGTPAANAAKKRTRKAPTAAEFDAEGNPITPSAKRARVQKTLELDSDGQPVTTPKGGRKPKTDADGNPVKPTPRVRKPKEQLDENGNVKPVRTRKAPVPKLDENGVEIPVNKGGRKSKAYIAAEAKAKADMEALLDRTEAAEQQQDAHLATTVLSVFDGKAVVPGEEGEGTIVVREEVEDAIVVKKEVDSGGSEDGEVNGEVDEDEEADAELAAQRESDRILFAVGDEGEEV
ncbi:hypothetical protein MMC18_007093 [Xylographa bjoerkii]|nr:hypothetical protein [Xylographa bjoerkii]